MANVLKLKRSAVARRIPGPADLTLGELALNTWDGRLFGKKNDGADAIVEFLSSDGAFKPDVRAATLANITLAGVQTVDSVVLAAGDRVLVRSQSTAAQNGVYIVSASAWSRATGRVSVKSSSSASWRPSPARGCSMAWMRPCQKRSPHLGATWRWRPIALTWRR